jgi:hypothetical protein
MEQVEDARIIVVDISGAVVAQKIIESLKRFRDVLIALAIQDIQPLARVRMEKPQPVFRRTIRWRAVRRSGAQKNYCYWDGKKFLFDSRKDVVSKVQISGQSNAEWFKVY